MGGLSYREREARIRELMKRKQQLENQLIGVDLAKLLPGARMAENISVNNFQLGEV